MCILNTAPGSNVVRTEFNVGRRLQLDRPISINPHRRHCRFCAVSDCTVFFTFYAGLYGIRELYRRVLVLLFIDNIICFLLNVYLGSTGACGSGAKQICTGLIIHAYGQFVVVCAFHCIPGGSSGAAAFPGRVLGRSQLCMRKSPREHENNK